MTKEDAIANLIECQHNSDPYEAHTLADDTLCNFLEALGYGDVVEEWRKVDKWYA